MKEALFVTCEGAGWSMHATEQMRLYRTGLCPMCGFIVPVDDDGKAEDHLRLDALSMLNDTGDASE